MITYYMTTVYIYTQIAYIVLVYLTSDPRPIPGAPSPYQLGIRDGSWASHLVNSSPFGPDGVLPPSLAVEAVEGMEGMVTSPACGQQKQMETNGLVHHVELAIGENFLRDGLFVFFSA